MTTSRTKKSSFWARISKGSIRLKTLQKKKIKIDHLMIFAQQLAAMLEAGLPLLSALDALSEQTDDIYFQAIIKEIKNDISQGTIFSEAIRKFPNAFPSFLVNMVEAGEASGSLALIMQEVAQYFKETSKTIKKVKGALAYPAIVMGLAFILVNVLMIFVIPVFGEMFNSFGAALPRPTQILLSTSQFLNHNILYILALLFLAYQFLARFFKHKKGKIIKDRLIRVLPIFGTLAQKVALARFTRTYALMMHSGVPILRALEIASSVSNNTYVENACLSMMKNVTQGGQVSEVILENKYFPPMVAHMAKAGEQTGNVEEMMLKIAQFYELEIDNTIATLSTLIEPIMIIVIGMIVATIVMAMFLPIFELSSVVGR